MTEYKCYTHAPAINMERMPQPGFYRCPECGEVFEELEDRLGGLMLVRVNAFNAEGTPIVPVNSFNSTWVSRYSNNTKEENDE